MDIIIKRFYFFYLSKIAEKYRHKLGISEEDLQKLYRQVDENYREYKKSDQE